MKTAIATGYAIEGVTLYDAADDVVRPFVELSQVLEHQAVPEDPRRPFEAIAARMRTRTSLGEQWRWGAWTRVPPAGPSGRERGSEARELVGHVVLGRNLQDNLHIRDIWIGVHPEHRRRGIAKALLARATEAIARGDTGPAPTDQGILVESFTHSRVPAGAAFAERAGLKPGLRARSSQLDLTSIDRRLLREWASLDPKGYHLEWIDGDTPDRLMDNVVAAQRAMNAMPREDLQWEDWKITAETIREWERLGRERGQKHLLVLAIDDATGATAGYTQLFYDPRVPSVLHQGGTAVIPEHRGKGIGKWVKAQVAERVLRDMPDARHIRTENAGTNAAMLAINVGMGFQPAWEEVIWQAPLADVRRYAEGAR